MVKVKNTFLAKRSPTLREAMSPAAMIDENSEKTESLFQALPVTMAMQQAHTPGVAPDSTEGIGKLLVAEFRILLSLAGRNASAIILRPSEKPLSPSLPAGFFIFPMFLV